MMNLIPCQAIAGAETPDPGNHFVLEPPAALEVGLLFAETDQKLPDQRSDRCFPLGRFDARPSVNLVRYCYCDIFHEVTVSHYHHNIM